MSTAPFLADFETDIWSLQDLKPHPDNPRKHPKRDSPKWKALMESLKHDYFDPIVVNRLNGLLVSGHFRRELLLELGEVQARVVVKDYDDVTHKARMIAANTLVGEWEETMLGKLAGELESAGVDIALMCLTQKEWNALLDAPETTDDSEHVEELLTKAELLQQKHRVQPGDLFQIGPHRLLCGPCESAESWDRLLGNGLADLAWWDPPYNVAYDRSQKQRGKQQQKNSESPAVRPVTILNDDMPAAEYDAILNSWFSAGAARLKPGAAFYIAHAETYGFETRLAAQLAGLSVKQCLIWVKQAFTMGRQDHHWQHEPILYGWKPGGRHTWRGGFTQSTVIDHQVDLRKLSKPELISLCGHLLNGTDTTVIREPRNVCSDLHPTVKPLRLVARQLYNSSKNGDTVLEMFGGSNTTMAAAQQIGLRCVTTELDPKYCAVALERMIAYGLQPERINGLV